MSTFSFYERSCLQVLLKLRSCKILKYWPLQRSRQDPTYFLMDEPFGELAATIFYSVDLLSFINCSSWARIILFSFFMEKKEKKKKVGKVCCRCCCNCCCCRCCCHCKKNLNVKAECGVYLKRKLMWGCRTLSPPPSSLSLFLFKYPHRLSLSAGEEESPRASGCA